MEITIFDKYGGVPVVTEIVRDFYKRVMRRPNLRRYFDGVTMEHLIHHQVAFVSIAMEKFPHDYVGRSMKAAHEGRGITATSFDLVVELLANTMRAHHVAEDDLETVVSNVREYRNQIVEK